MTLLLPIVLWYISAGKSTWILFYSLAFNRTPKSVYCLKAITQFLLCLSTLINALRSWWLKKVMSFMLSEEILWSQLNHHFFLSLSRWGTWWDDKKWIEKKIKMDVVMRTSWAKHYNDDTVQKTTSRRWYSNYWQLPLTYGQKYNFILVVGQFLHDRSVWKKRTKPKNHPRITCISPVTMPNRTESHSIEMLFISC